MKLLQAIRNRIHPPNTAPADGRSEMALGGARITGGIVQEEHNADLHGKLGLQAAAKMRRTDAQVRAVEKVLSLPIRSTVWLVEEPDDAGSAGVVRAFRSVA